MKKAAARQPARRGVILPSLIGAFLAIAILGLAGWLAMSSTPPPGPAPEAERVQAVQANMPFQILIPAYLPADFDRAGVKIEVNQAGPGGEPMVELTYRARTGGSVTLREWVPVNPTMETLANSRPVETKWGRSWLLTQSDNLVALWTDIGPLRVSTFTTTPNVLPRDRLVQVANTLGPPTNDQVFTFLVPEAVKDAPPPKPFEVKPNADGVQEFTLVITPGGYSPLRIALKKGVRARLIFRELGQVGCGNTLIFPADPQNPAGLTLANEQDMQVLEFTPNQAGEFPFWCSHYMYRGVLTVRE